MQAGKEDTSLILGLPLVWETLCPKWKKEGKHPFHVQTAEVQSEGCTEKALLASEVVVSYLWGVDELEPWLQIGAVSGHDWMGFGWTQDAELGKAEQQVADLTVTSGDLTFGDETRSAFEQHCVCSLSISELLGLQIWIHGVMECVSRRISSWSLRERMFKLKTENLIGPYLTWQWWSLTWWTTGRAWKPPRPTGPPLSRFCLLIHFTTFSLSLQCPGPLCTLWATPPVLSMWPCNLKLDAKKSKHAGLAQQNGFGPIFLHSLLRLVKGTTKPSTYQRRV